MKNRPTEFAKFQASEIFRRISEAHDPFTDSDRFDGAILLTVADLPIASQPAIRAELDRLLLDALAQKAG